MSEDFSEDNIRNQNDIASIEKAEEARKCLILLETFVLFSVLFLVVLGALNYKYNF